MLIDYRFTSLTIDYEWQNRNWQSLDYRVPVRWYSYKTLKLNVSSLEYRWVYIIHTLGVWGSSQNKLSIVCGCLTNELSINYTNNINDKAGRIWTIHMCYKRFIQQIAITEDWRVNRFTFCTMLPVSRTLKLPHPIAGSLWNQNACM
jgi:hypothetical protein